MYKHPEEAAFENLAGRFLYHYCVSFFELKAGAHYTEQDRKKPNDKKCKI
jgi:hypothetical protein